MLVAVQLDITWEDPPANCAAVRQLLVDANVPPGALVVLPEMFNTGFSLNTDAAAEDWDTSPTRQSLAELASDLNSHVVGGMAVRVAPDRCENQAPVFAPDGRVLCRYAKMHPFTFANEHTAYAPGDAFDLFEWGPFTVSPFVCYDLRFPELFRRAARHGADLFTVGANWPARREDHWIALLQARAIENQAYVVGVNRCGNDPDHAYSGRSLIIDPRGQILADAGNDPSVICASPDHDALRQYRTDFPALSDIRDDCLPAPR
ncbi:MAG: amidohydrolase [Planctomycetaceae bacterium]|nr:amidohydrolase [Planctomycetaceae bacterium]